MNIPIQSKRAKFVKGEIFAVQIVLYNEDGSEKETKTIIPKYIVEGDRSFCLFDVQDEL